ncbi:DUF2231 domain-containing protein [Schumannella soli]|uniref:DUF2231 domain-containing protein n=1 Tax=Schumannella soli TaxID=2590779 RepID=A0A506Y4H0_9MICO|nr:DUF2231 domain-containing protein [Schumannella soli]TPW77486.1 DUF2231 domain-containing protein [Schumannella soli]
MTSPSPAPTASDDQAGAPRDADHVRADAPLAVRAADDLGDLVELDRLAAALDGVGRRIPARARGLLHGEPLGHPAHPLVVVVPIGFWVAASIVGWLPGGARMARVLTGLGALAAAPSAATGLADWLHLGRRARRVGAAHALANSVGVALATASWSARRGHRRHVPLRAHLLSAGVLAVIGVSGYLGGHLAYRMGAGVDSDARTSE